MENSRQGYLNTGDFQREVQNNTLSHAIMRNLASWPLFVSITMLSLTGAWIYLRYTIPVYEAKATILLKDEKKGIDDSKMLASFDLLSTTKIVENEIEVLRSRAVMKEVVKKLGLYAPVTFEGGLNYLSAYVVSPIKIQLKNPEQLSEKEKIYFDYIESQNAVLIDNHSYPLNVWINSKWGVIKFLTNSRSDLITQTKKMFFSLVDVRKIADGLLSSLDVAPTNKLSTMIVLTFKDQVPKRGEDILNSLIDEYNQITIEDKNKLATNALSFVEQRLNYVVGELDSVETVIQHFKTNKGVVNINEQGRIFLESVESNDKRISEVNVQLAILDQIEKYIKTKDEKPGIVPSTLGLNDGVLLLLLTKLYDAEMQYERLKRTTAENNPILASLQNQIEKIKPSILENIQNQRSNLEASKNNLIGTSDRYSSLLKSIPQKERQLLDITRQQSIKNNIYTFLLQKREEAALSFAMSVEDSRLIDNAASGWAPVSPNKRMIYIIALLLGVGIPVTFVGLKELFDMSIQSKSDIESLISIPILGEINYGKCKEPFVMLNDETSYVAEQIRLIRTSLSYLVNKPGLNKILLTSSVQGEGKSFVAINLATSLALTNKKVVLVDLDLRRPRLSLLFKLKPASGMSDYLKGRAERQQIVYKTSISENLYLVPAGEIPSFPSELISNGLLEDLFNYFAEKFDYVIVETPPVNAITDAYIVSKYCDGTLFIVKQNKTSKENIYRLRDNQKIRSLGNVAIIFNGVKPLGFGIKGNNYAYGKSKM